MGRPVWLLIVGAMLSLFLACGGGSGDAASQETADSPDVSAQAATTAGQVVVDACGLITDAELAELVGRLAGPGVDEEAPAPYAACDWETADGAVIKVSVITFDDAQRARADFESTQEMNRYSPVEGVGERAYSAAPTFDDITAQQGRYEVGVYIAGLAEDDAAELEVAISIARTMIGRLP